MTNTRQKFKHYWINSHLITWPTCIRSTNNSKMYNACAKRRATIVANVWPSQLENTLPKSSSTFRPKENLCFHNNRLTTLTLVLVYGYVKVVMVPCFDLLCMFSKKYFDRNPCNPIRMNRDTKIVKDWPRLDWRFKNFVHGWADGVVRLSPVILKI